MKQTKFECVYLYAAVEPATAASVALLTSTGRPGTMNVFLLMLAESSTPESTRC